MLKQKKATPQDLWKARREREEREKEAHLPPGLVNLGNSCYMNSVLQGLIATRELYALVHFSPMSHSFQAASPRPILSTRSPQLTNGHGLGGSSDKEWVQGMPLGDGCIKFLFDAWFVQDEGKRENMNPRDILTLLGRKYDQYLDFRQQDAHEFLRLLLDAMRMEEFDIIKNRQPPPPKEKRRRLRSRQTAPTSALIPEVDDSEKLESFVDMLFGGKLASFLVCEKCKHVSHTYEDFNDLSLSLKPEDFAKDRKRNRLKSLAKKFGLRQDSQSDLPRSSSVPPSPNRKSFDSSADDIPAVDSRRRSHELVLSELRKIAATGDVEHVAEPEAIASDKEPSIRVDFVEPEKVKKDSDKSDDNWARLGRRISKSVGKKRKGRSMSRETKPKLKEDTPTAFDADLVAASRSNSPAITDASATADQAGILSRPTSPRLPSPSPLRESQPTSSSKRSKSPPPPKLSREETAYLRHILADVAPASAHHFALFRPASASSAGVTPINGHSLWTKLSQLPGIEECLRWFTSVEMLDGENMVGCRRCWKMANGVYKDRPVTEDRSDSEEENDGSPVSSPVDDIFTPAQTSLSASNVAFTPDIQSSPELDRNPSPASASALSITGDPSLLSFGETAPSASSLPTTIESTKILKKAPPPMPLDDIRHDESPVGSPQSHPDSYVGLPIPLISTTAPESPMSQPNTAKTVVPRSMYSVASASLSAPRVMRRHPQKRFNGDSDVFSEASSDSFDETESEASQSDASSMGSPFVSPNASHERFHTRSPAFTNSTNGDNPPKLPPRLLSKVPRSKQIIMRRCYKRYLISEPPPVLVIHLKRFQQTSKNPMMSSFSTGFKKLDDYVTFPENLDLTPFLAPKKEDFGLSKKGKKSDRKSEKPPCMYRLYAVVVHIGNMLGGHYIAYTALSDSGHSSAASIPASEIGPQTTSDASIPHIEAPTRQWAYISDTAVRLTTLDEVLKSKAYLCMYERIS